MQFGWGYVPGPPDRLGAMKVAPNYDAWVAGADAHCVGSPCRFDHEPFPNLGFGACYCQIFEVDMTFPSRMSRQVSV